MIGDIFLLPTTAATVLSIFLPKSVKISAFKSLPFFKIFPKAQQFAVTQSSWLLSFTCTPNKKVHKPEKQKTHGSPQQAGGSTVALKSILTNQGNFLNLVPVNIPVLRNVPGVPT